MGAEPLYGRSVALLAGLLPLYLLRFAVASIPTNALEVAIIGLSIAGAVQAPIRRSWKTAARGIPVPVMGLVVAFIVASVVSTLISPHLRTSLGILKGWVILPVWYAFLLYAETYRDQFRAGQFKLKVIDCLMLSGLVISLLGISQFGALERLRGVYDVPNSLALFIVPLIVLNLLQPAVGLGRLPALVMVVALIGTQSLGGVLSVFLAVGLFILVRRPLNTSKAKVLAAGLVVLIPITIMIPKIEYLVQSGSSAHVRLQLWDISQELIQENPLVGIGLGVFEPLYQEKLHARFMEYEQLLAAGRVDQSSRPLAEFVFRDPHNWILSFWLHTGLLGLAAFVGLNIWVLAKDRLTSPVSYALIALLVFGLVDTVYWKNDLSVLYWVLVALLVKPGELEARELRTDSI